jgi:hypothetical protein
MFGTAKMSPAAAVAVGLVALAFLTGCGGEQSVASKSAAAFREAQKKGETFEGAGHSHGHGAVTPGGTHAEPEAETEEQHPAGHDHGTAEAPAAGGQEGRGHGAHAAAPAPGREGAGHEAHGAAGAEPQGGSHSGHGRSTASPGGRMPEHLGETGHAGQHAGHGTASPQPPVQGAQPPGAGHEGHSPSQGGTPSVASAPAPVAVPPEQPARTLRPDPLDAPAATSVVDAQRSAEMAREMEGGHGGHGGHGSTTYRHVDAGRGPGAYQGSEEGSEEPPAGAGTQNHDHGSEHAQPPPGGKHTGDEEQERRKG